MFSAASVSQRSYSPFYHFVTGGAGTGKTLLIKALYETFVRHFDPGRDRDMATPSVVLCAFTGKAAFNINGQTIHKLFSIPVQQYGSGVSRDLPTLSGSVAHSMSVVLRDLQIVIIDKISMVDDPKMLESINKRLHDMFCSTKPFGGKFLLVFGDFLQITLVHSVPLYSSSVANQNNFAALFGTRIWDLFFVHTVQVDAEHVARENSAAIELAYREFTLIEEEDLEAMMERMMGDRASDNAENDNEEEAPQQRREANEENNFGRYTMEMDDCDQGDF